MPRSRRNDFSLADELLATLEIAPAWLGPVIAACAFGGLRWVLPSILLGSSGDNAAHNTMFPVLAGIVIALAPWAGFGILLLWLLAEIKKYANRRRLDSQDGIDSIRRLEWREFELLLAEAFRRQGYDVETLGGA